MFAERLRQLISEKNVTMRKVANDTGIAHSNIIGYASGAVMPNSATLVKLCRYFDASADWLLGLSNFRKIKS